MNDQAEQPDPDLSALDSIADLSAINDALHRINDRTGRLDCSPIQREILRMLTRQIAGNIAKLAHMLGTIQAKHLKP